MKSLWMFSKLLNINIIIAKDSFTLTWNDSFKLGICLLPTVLKLFRISIGLNLFVFSLWRVDVPILFFKIKMTFRGIWYIEYLMCVSRNVRVVVDVYSLDT